MYVYYVVFDMMGKNGGKNGIIGKGYCVINRKRKITGYTDIKEIENSVVENNKEEYPDLNGVLITNFILLRKEKKNEKNYTDEYTDNYTDNSNNNTNNS